MGPSSNRTVDLHCHVFPDRLEDWLALLPANWEVNPQLQSLRDHLRTVLSPVMRGIHRAQPIIRHLPPGLRLPIDEVAGGLTLPSLLLESTVRDLYARMDEAGISRSVIIAHPPFASNDFVLEAAAASEGRLIPAVNIPASEERPAVALGDYVRRGARFLKIHAAADGENAESPRYLALLRKAADLGIPVILHTGCLHSHLIYRDPEMGDPRQFRSWFKRFPHLTFILAHLGFHDPNTAIELAAEHDNLLLETSWQPFEIIGEAVRRVGADRVLFGTDWPFIGDNFRVGLKRLEDAAVSDALSSEQVDQIAFQNAEKLLGEMEQRFSDERFQSQEPSVASP